MIAGLKNTYSVTNSSVADQFGISYTTLMRWKRRLSTGKPAVAKPVKNAARVQVGCMTLLTMKFRGVSWIGWSALSVMKTGDSVQSRNVKLPG